MPIGSLTARIVLDQPSRIHCGTDDLVTGNVHVQYHTTSGAPAADLFGPLQVIISFHGRAKTKVVKNRGNNSRVTYRGRAPLFSIAGRLHDGPFRAVPHQVQKIPFALRFPAKVDPRSVGDFRPDPMFNTEILPPTFQLDYSGFAHRFSCFTEYRMGVSIQMPGIDVRTVGPSEYEEAVILYEQPRTPQHAVLGDRNTHRHHVMIQNEYLLPEVDRPTGFKQKAKAVFKSDYYPQYQFDVQLSAPCHLYIGQTMAFEVNMKPNIDKCTAPLVPEISLTKFLVSLSAYTQVRAERQFFSEPSSEGNEACLVVSGTPDTLHPFSKANDFTKIVNTRVLGDIPSTFSTWNISRTYTMNVEFSVAGANKTFKIERKFGVIIHPPVEVPPAMIDGRDGPSSALQDPPPMALPVYDAPPGYDEGAESADEDTAPAHWDSKQNMKSRAE